MRFSDLDALGHVNSLSIAQYFENRRVAMFNGLSPGWPHLPAIFVLVNLTIDYRHELHYPADLRVGLKLLAMGDTSLQLAAAVFRGDTAIAASTSVQVLIDTTTRKPTAITLDLREKLQRHLS